MVVPPRRQDLAFVRRQVSGHVGAQGATLRVPPSPQVQQGTDVAVHVAQLVKVFGHVGRRVTNVCPVIPHRRQVLVHMRGTLVVVGFWQMVQVRPRTPEMQLQIYHAVKTSLTSQTHPPFAVVARPAKIHPIVARHRFCTPGEFYKYKKIVILAFNHTHIKETACWKKNLISLPPCVRFSGFIMQSRRAQWMQRSLQSKHQALRHQLAQLEHRRRLATAQKGPETFHPHYEWSTMLARFAATPRPVSNDSKKVLTHEPDGDADSDLDLVLPNGQHTEPNSEPKLQTETKAEPGPETETESNEWPEALRPVAVISIRRNRMDSMVNRVPPSWWKYMGRVRCTDGRAVPFGQLVRSGQVARLSRGQYGCLQSHLTAWKQLAAHPEWTCVTVLEDDVSLSCTHAARDMQRVREALRELQDHHMPWGLLYWGHGPYATKNQPVTVEDKQTANPDAVPESTTNTTKTNSRLQLVHWRRPMGSQGFFAYTISRELAVRWLARWRQARVTQTAIDVWANEAAQQDPHRPAYALEPSLCYVVPGPSETTCMLP